MPIDGTAIELLLPEIIIGSAATILFLGGTFVSSRGLWRTVCGLVFVVAAVVLFRQHGLTLDETLRAGPLQLDQLGLSARWLSLAMGICFVWIVSRDGVDHLTGERLGMVLLAFAGLMIVGWSGDLILLFLGLELISIPSYVLLFVGRSDRSSSEAATKYFFLSLLSSAVMMFGFALLYGVAGTTDLTLMGARINGLSDDGFGRFLPLAIVFVFSGLGFKIAAVPFHFYAPDVYQATTNGNAGLLAVVPKIAGFVALLRLFPLVLVSTSKFGWQVALILAVLTMTIGNVCALWQSNIRRLMAYSSIAHAGYMLIGLAVALVAGDQRNGYGGFAACLFYLVVYSFASAGTFAVLAHLSTPSQEINCLNDLSGLFQNRPIVAGLLAVFMFSLMGIPPLAGFWGKFTLFTGAVATSRSLAGSQSMWYLVLAIIGALNAAIAAAYYLRVVGVTFFSSAEGDLGSPRISGSVVAAVACASMVLVLGFYPAPTMEHFRQVGNSINQAAASSMSNESITAQYDTGESPHIVPANLP